MAITTFWRKATNCGSGGGGGSVIVYNDNVEFPDKVISLGDTDSNGVKIPILGHISRHWLAALGYINRLLVR